MICDVCGFAPQEIDRERDCFLFRITFQNPWNQREELKGWYCYTPYEERKSEALARRTLRGTQWYGTGDHDHAPAHKEWREEWSIHPEDHQ